MLCGVRPSVGRRLRAARACVPQPGIRNFCLRRHFVLPEIRRDKECIRCSFHSDCHAEAESHFSRSLPRREITEYETMSRVRCDASVGKLLFIFSRTAPLLFAALSSTPFPLSGHDPCFDIL